MTAPGSIAARAFEAGLLSLGYQLGNSRERVDVALSRQVLAKATEADPTMADAWLARLAAGDTSLAVYKGLWLARAKLGVALGRYNLEPLHLRRPDRGHVIYESGMLINAPIASEDAITAAYVAALVRVHDYDGAVAVFDGQLGSARPFTTYGAVALYYRTERWREVVDAGMQIRDCADPVVAAAARSLLIGAYTSQGLYTDALALEDETVSGLKKLLDLLPQATATVKFFTGICHRSMGNEPKAAENLRAALVADPDYVVAREYLDDPEHTMAVVDQAVIDSRTDPWDPTTGKSAEELAKPKISPEQRAAKLAEAELELTKFIGLEPVKKQVRQLKALVKMNAKRAARGLPPITAYHHLVFAGPPGTGKTTIARVVAKIYCGLGLLDSDKVIEKHRADLVGQHIGDTEALTTAAVDSALDGVLFLDEAYALSATGMKNDFGYVAIDTLVARMDSDRKRLVVIVAGYRNELETFIAANDGLRRRLPVTITFEPYSPGELVDIAVLTAKEEHENVISEAGKDLLLRVCTYLHTRTAKPKPKPSDLNPAPKPIIDILGNAGFMRNVVDQAALAMATRMDEADNAEIDLSEIDLEAADQDEDVAADTEDELITYTEDDIRAALRLLLDEFAYALDDVDAGRS